jgi:hypothetical protein
MKPARNQLDDRMQQPVGWRRVAQRFAWLVGSYHLAVLIWAYSPNASDQLGVQCDRGVEHL